MRTCGTKGEFEQFFGPSSPRSAFLSVQGNEPVTLACWDDTVLEENGIIYERALIIEFDPTTGRQIGQSQTTHPQPSLWERCKRWIKQFLP
jgi:hypothetical protein